MHPFFELVFEDSYMTLDVEMHKSLQESCRAALAFTGSIEGAERAVTNAIAAAASDLSADALLVETARSALQHGTFSDGLTSWLPLELQVLFRQSPTRRYCFILRVLLALDSN
jgi:hypothetical protein